MSDDRDPRKHAEHICRVLGAGDDPCQIAAVETYIRAYIVGPVLRQLAAERQAHAETRRQYEQLLEVSMQLGARAEKAEDTLTEERERHEEEFKQVAAQVVRLHRRLRASGKPCAHSVYEVLDRVALLEGVAKAAAEEQRTWTGRVFKEQRVLRDALSALDRYPTCGSSKAGMTACSNVTEECQRKEGGGE